MSSKKKPIDTEPAKVGRPKANVDPRLVEQLASIGCSNKEIAAACNCSTDTIERNFAAEITKGRENGKTRLRKKQIEVALAGNVTMLIFLGKNMLGQADKQEISGPDGTPVMQLPLSTEQDKNLSALVEIARANAKK
jgi:precorrin-4 methylase